MRYIDADALLTDEMTHTLPNGCGRSSGRVVVFVEDIESIPTADVVPRETVEQIFAEIEKALNTFDGSWADTVIDTQCLIEELKKKYTGGEDNES